MYILVSPAYLATSTQFNLLQYMVALVCNLHLVTLCSEVGTPHFLRYCRFRADNQV